MTAEGKPGKDQNADELRLMAAGPARGHLMAGGNCPVLEQWFVLYLRFHSPEIFRPSSPE